MLLLEQLRADGIVPRPAEPPEVLGPGLAEYLGFLCHHRGLSGRTVERQRLHVSRLLSHLGVRTDGDLARITVDRIDGHLVRASRGRRRQSMGSVCASIRGFLGHLHMRGVLRSDRGTGVAGATSSRTGSGNRRDLVLRSPGRCRLPP